MIVEVAGDCMAPRHGCDFLVSAAVDVDNILAVGAAFLVGVDNVAAVAVDAVVRDVRYGLEFFG